MIEIKISEDALQDLNDGFLFYEAQESGLGDYSRFARKRISKGCGFPVEFTGSSIMTIAAY